MDYFKYLPKEITLEILSRVPSESVLECKLVCKSWRNIVSHDPSFPQMHLDHLNHPSTDEDSCKLSFFAFTENDFSYFEYNDENHERPIEKFRKIKSDLGGCLVGSCNGLICIAHPHDPETSVCIFNPFIKEYVMLPEIRTDLFDDYKQYVSWKFGFGYVSLTDEYKVVGIYVSTSKYIEVYIYTLGSGNGWRELGRNFSFEFCPMHDICDNEHGSFANGAIYWIGYEVEMILTFDLIEEKFREHLAPPTLPPNTKLGNQTIGVLDGFLYIAIYNKGADCNDIWLLKEKNDNHSKKDGKRHQSLGWSKEYSVDQYSLLAVTKSGGVLTYLNNDDYVNIYDTKTSTSKRLVDFDELVFQVSPHKNTFLSLKLLGEEAKKKRKTMKFS